MTTLLADAWTTLKNDWTALETKAASLEQAAVSAIGKDFAPFVSTLASKAKQGASDALGIAGTIWADVAPALNQGVEAALDAGLAAATKGATAPANGTINTVVGGLLQNVEQAASSWALSKLGGLPPTSSSNSEPSSGS